MTTHNSDPTLLFNTKLRKNYVHLFTHSQHKHAMPDEVNLCTLQKISTIFTKIRLKEL